MELLGWVELLQKEMDHLRKHSVTASTLNSPWTWWKESYHSSPVREATMPTPMTLLALCPPLLKPKPRVTLSYLIPRAYAKASGRSAVSMTYRPTSRAIEPLKTSLFPLRIRIPWKTKSGAIYWFQCGELACGEEYIGETSRTFGERFKEHWKDTSPIFNHSCITGHTMTQDNFQIIGREDHGIARTAKESIYIRVNNPTLNRKHM